MRFISWKFCFTKDFVGFCCCCCCSGERESRDWDNREAKELLCKRAIRFSMTNFLVFVHFVQFFISLSQNVVQIFPRRFWLKFETEVIQLRPTKHFLWKKSKLFCSFPFFWLSTIFHVRCIFSTIQKYLFIFYEWHK